jgi:hypothetical protein
MHSAVPLLEINETPRLSVRFFCGNGWGALVTSLGLCGTGKLKNNRRQSFSRVAEEMPDLIAEEVARLWNDKSLGTRGILR